MDFVLALQQGLLFVPEGEQHWSAIPEEFRHLLPVGKTGRYQVLDLRKCYNGVGDQGYVACDDVGSHAEKDGSVPPNRSGYFERPGYFHKEK